MPDRTILHCDLNSFYASVECIGHPELRRVPMAVCGAPELRHGIILAKNELAKKAGVQTAETVWQAKRKCPSLVIVPPHHERYAELSKKVNEVYLRYTDMVEPFGIDESWLDVTGSRSLFGDGETIANELRETMKREFELTISVGVSFCKVLAKLGSDLKKPDATTVISRENLREVVWPRPAGELLFVGRRTAAALEKFGIRTIGDVANADPEFLERVLGRMGRSVYDYARGEDNSPVRRYGEREEAKSMGSGMTFTRDLVGEQDIKAGLLALSDEVAGRLRKYGLRCTTVVVQIRSPDFRDISRRTRLARPTALSREIFLAALETVQSNWQETAPIRQLTVTAAGLVREDEAAEQLDLFASPTDERRREKRERLENTIDSIRGRFGGDAIVFGAVQGSDIFGAHGADEHLMLEDERNKEEQE